MCYLKIPKDCLVRQYKDTAFGYGGTYRPNTKHYVFRLPGEEYDGYTFTVTELFGRFDSVQALGDWYSVYVSSDDLPIVVKRTENREDGKRYKQYKFTPDEINTLYGNAMRHAVALITIYANDGTRKAKEVLNTKYTVGIVDGCWFICSEFLERRRIDTKGVKILGFISAIDAQKVKEIIERHKEKGRDIHTQCCAVQDKRRKIEYINDDVRRTELPELNAIYDITHNVLKSLSVKYDELMRELDKLDADFGLSLKQYYVDKAV